MYLVMPSLNTLGTALVHNVPVQACPVCRATNYKGTILSALPKLKNLDGERNPRRSSYFAIVDQAAQVRKEMEQFQPDFAFTDPKPWMAQETLQFPPVPSVNHADVVHSLQGCLAARVDSLEAEMQRLCLLVQAREVTEQTN